ncbi:MAG: DUF951 domain-containing protein [Clostridia bacterium]|nr:DUF951 domain-containing protein [Clostridia bacterium]
MDIRMGDILNMKKTHPCGNGKFLVLRVGMDIRLKCLGCGRMLLLPRMKIEKHICSIIREEEI